jgi:hypothetical protein
VQHTARTGFRSAIIVPWLSLQLRSLEMHFVGCPGQPQARCQLTGGSSATLPACLTHLELGWLESDRQHGSLAQTSLLCFLLTSGIAGAGEGGTMSIVKAQ